MGQRIAKLLPVTLACIAASLPLSCIAADNVNPLNFDFAPSPTGQKHNYAHIFCSIEGNLNHNCSGTATPEIRNATPLKQDQLYWWANMGNDFDTRFVQEIVTIDGVEYYHLVIGDPADGFAQEVYIARSPISTRLEGGGQRFSDSGGAACFPGSGTFEQQEGCVRSNASADPLRRDATFTGNGTGNPSKMIMKQVISNNDQGFTQEFLKGSLAHKPVITQTSVDSDISANFVIDMSNSDYNTNDTPGTMINTLNLTAPGLAEGMGDFVFTPTTGTNITAGRYTFKRTMVLNYELENGWTRDIPSSEYVYYDGTVDPVLNVDWEAFRDPSQNPHSLK